MSLSCSHSACQEGPQARLVPFRLQLDQKGPWSLDCVPRAPTHPLLSLPAGWVTCNIRHARTVTPRLGRRHSSRAGVPIHLAPSCTCSWLHMPAARPPRCPWSRAGTHSALLAHVQLATLAHNFTRGLQSLQRFGAQLPCTVLPAGSACCPHPLHYTSLANISSVCSPRTMLLLPGGGRCTQLDHQATQIVAGQLLGGHRRLCTRGVC